MTKKVHHSGGGRVTERGQRPKMGIVSEEKQTAAGSHGFHIRKCKQTEDPVNLEVASLTIIDKKTIQLR